MSKIELTTKQLFGYAFLIVGIIMFIYVAVTAILLVNGTIQPITVDIAGINSENALFAGIILQIGLFALLIGIGYAFAKIGLNITKE